jgi:cobyrinic acid a,c-diamide synthase
LSTRSPPPPSGWAKYPDPEPARQALADHHGVDPAMVLPTSGGAEGFVLLARALHPRHPVVVHPQFTEPEAALRAAGHRVDRLLLGPADGFQLNPAAVPRDADLVVVGNPTNPTGVLHPAEALKSLNRPGRVVVVDEAFMDATDGAQSLISEDMEGLLVLRSLTKTYGLAGIRAGYVVGDPDLIARLAAQQPPWSVSTPAIAAMIACCSAAAEQHRRGLAEALPGLREDLTGKLRTIGLTVIDSQAPFVLVDTSSIDPLRSIRRPLAGRGFAVRRGETFPGLGPTWIRLAVRDPATHAGLVEAISDLVASPEPQNSLPHDSQPDNSKENPR